MDAIDLHNMGSDFTIYVEHTSYVGRIASLGASDCDVFITGSVGESLFINHREDMNWAHGLVLAANDSSVLSIDSSITVDVYGPSGAIAISTAANPAIVYEPLSAPISGHLQTGSFAFADSYFMKFDTPDWTFINEHGLIEQHIVFASNGTHNPDYNPPVSSEPVESLPPSQSVDPNLGGLSDIPRLTITDTDNTLYVVWENGSFQSAVSSYQHLASYDPATNTLTIGAAQLEKIEANAMGSDFTIHVAQDVTVGAISSTAYQDDGTITLSGENTTLTVNNTMTYAYGIFVDAAGGNCYLQVEPGISVMAVGQKAGIAISNSWASPGIVYDPTLTYIYEPVMIGDYSFPSNGSDSDSTQDTTVIDEKDAFQGPSTHVYIEGAYIEQESEPPVEEPPLTSYSELYITLPNSIDPIYIVKDGQLTENAAQLNGLSYDYLTNTLTLTDFTCYSLESNGMGALTIDLYGENHIEWIHSGDTLVFGGDPYATLTVNESQQFEQGIQISANGTDSYLQVNWGPELTVHGSEAAVAVYNSAAAYGIRLGSDVSLSGEVVSGSFSGDDSTPLSGLRSWTVLAENEISAHVVLSRDYTHDPSEQSTLSITVGGVPTVLFENGRPTEHEWPAGVAYLHASNTLVLDQVTFESIDAHRMGEGFTIDLRGVNYGKTIYSTGSSGSADGSLYVTGEHFESGTEYGSLFLSADSEPYSIWVNANGGSSTLQIGWIYEAIFTAAEAAVLVSNTTAPSAISTHSNILSALTENGTDWTFTDYDTGEASKEIELYGGFGGGQEYEILNGIKVWDFPSYDAKRWIMANYYQNVFVESTNEYDTAEPVDGMVYDESTNTLTLTNCTARSIEAVLMGDSFTICLVGDNYLNELLINAGSVTFTGTGTLSVGDAQPETSRGICLEAQNRNHWMQVDSGVTLRVSDDIYIHATTAKDPLILSPGVSATAQLVKNHLRYTSYDVETDFAAGSANYSFAEYGRTSKDFTEYLHSSYVEITGN